MYEALHWGFPQASLIPYLDLSLGLVWNDAEFKEQLGIKLFVRWRCLGWIITNKADL